MPYAEVAPRILATESLVACYWTITGAAGRTPHRVLPDGCIDIIFEAGKRPRVVGAMREAIIAPPGEGRTGIIGIRFKPGEAARLLPEAPRDLTDRKAVLSDLEGWRDAANVIEDAVEMALESAYSRGDVFLIDGIASTLDAFLSSRLRSNGHEVDPRVRRATELLARGGSVADAAAAACLSERQLARRFEGRVGVAPKVFGRVMRLQRAWSSMTQGTPVSEAAMIAGYADQAHFTRDAKALALATPGALLRELGGSAPAPRASDPPSALLVRGGKSPDPLLAAVGASAEAE